MNNYYKKKKKFEILNKKKKEEQEARIWVKMMNNLIDQELNRLNPTK